MNGKWITVVLIAFLAIISVDDSAWAQTGLRPEKDRREMEIKVKVLQSVDLGGPRVDIKRRDNTRLKGHISQAGSSTFNVLDKTGNTVTVKYSDVKKLSRQRSRRVKIAMWIGVAYLAASLAQ